jgi:K(+)-stimulated pyrophosphate-energized sodium pump
MPIVGGLGLITAGGLYLLSFDNPRAPLMPEIAAAIHEGPMVFLRREYQILLVFVLAVFALLGLFIRGATAMAFLGGALCSMLVGATPLGSYCRCSWRTPAAPAIMP